MAMEAWTKTSSMLSSTSQFIVKGPQSVNATHVTHIDRKSSLWSADRLRSSDPQFTISDSVPAIYFTGEMVFKDMFESYSELEELKDVAQILATTDEWPALYDEAQLASNKVPVYAATYIEDMYVHFDLATATASKIKNSKQFITNTIYHDGLRSKSGEIMRQLFSLREDSVD
ncbi:unnamed protein product [Penicillium bialowiezense]